MAPSYTYDKHAARDTSKVRRFEKLHLTGSAILAATVIRGRTVTYSASTLCPKQVMVNPSLSGSTMTEERRR